MASLRWPRPALALPLLWLAALALALHQLGNVPLRDWDEAIVARVALETSRHSGAALLLPTYLGEPYLNKPPGMHLAIAASMRLWRWLSGAGDAALPPEAVVRLVPALAASLLVPLLGLVQARLRPGDRAAVACTALVTLTLLPLARHGRLAMLDGAQLSAMALVWLGLLSGGRSPAGHLGSGLMAGLGSSLLLLSKAPVALPVLAAGLLLRALDGELSRQAWGRLGAGLVLGLLPGVGWHLAHLLARGGDALVMWGPQGLARLTSTLENHGGGPVVPLLQVLQGGWPWLPLWPAGLVLAWRDRRRRRGRWTLGLTLIAALLVFPLRTQLPWYSLLLWPPFALACGPALAGLVRGSLDRRTQAVVPLLWLGVGTLLLLAAAASLLPAAQALAPVRPLVLPAGTGLLAGGWLLRRRGDTNIRRRRGVLLVAAGWVLSLGALFSTPLWNWELNEQPPISPIVEVAGVPAQRGSGPLVINEDEPLSPSAIWYIDPIRLDQIPARLSKGGGDSDHGPQPAAPGYELLSHAERPPLPPGGHCRLEIEGAEGWRRWHCSAG